MSTRKFLLDQSSRSRKRIAKLTALLDVQIMQNGIQSQALLLSAREKMHRFEEYGASI